MLGVRVSTDQVVRQNESQLIMSSYPSPVPASQVGPRNEKPHINKTSFDNLETQPVRGSTNQVVLQNESQLIMNSYRSPVLAYQDGPENKSQPVVNANQASVSTNQVASEKGQPVMNTYPGAATTNQVAPQSEPQEVMDFQLTRDSSIAPGMKPSPVKGNNEPGAKIRSSETASINEDTFEQKNGHAPSDANDTAPQVEQKVEEWVETKYLAPAAYDSNKDGLLDAQEIDSARKDGNLHIQKTMVEIPEKSETFQQEIKSAREDGNLHTQKTMVEIPEKGETFEEELSSKAVLPKRGKKMKKSGGKRRRRKRRK